MEKCLINEYPFNKREYFKKYSLFCLQNKYFYVYLLHGPLAQLVRATDS